MPKKTELMEKKQVEKIKGNHYYQAVGRRKESRARVRLYTVKGDSMHLKNKEIKPGEIIVNNLPAEQYFYGATNKNIYMEPFRTTNTLDRFAVSALVEGGGKMGQVKAFVHAVARALVTIDEEKYKPMLRKKGFMTRDPRAKERRKAGFAQKARAKKQSPKR